MMMDLAGARSTTGPLSCAFGVWSSSIHPGIATSRAGAAATHRRAVRCKTSIASIIGNSSDPSGDSAENLHRNRPLDHSEHEVRPPDHRIEFIVVGGRDQHQRDVFAVLAGHFRGCELFVSRDQMGLLQGGDQVNDHQVGAPSVVQSLRPLGVKFQLIGGLIGLFGGLGELLFVSNQDNPHFGKPGPAGRARIVYFARGSCTTPANRIMPLGESTIAHTNGRSAVKLTVFGREVTPTVTSVLAAASAPSSST